MRNDRIFAVFLPTRGMPKTTVVTKKVRKKAKHRLLVLLKSVDQQEGARSAEEERSVGGETGIFTSSDATG